MNPPFLLAGLLLVLAACHSDTNQNESSTTANPRSDVVQTTDTLCFERYSGSQKQDTASIWMVIKGTAVSGRFSNYPYQKDARVGTITGTQNGDLINGTWRYSQEGMDDSVRFEFKLQGNTLLQKKTGFDRNTGREILSDTAGFSLEFNKLDCGSMD